MSWDNISKVLKRKVFEIALKEPKLNLYLNLECSLKTTCEKSSKRTNDTAKY
jgi:hypothetical protein